MTEAAVPPGLQIFSDAELAAMEAGADGVDARARAGCLPQACFQTTLARGGGLKRTKLFFGARCAPGGYAHGLHMVA
jgi:hypothetical protein